MTNKRLPFLSKSSAPAKPAGTISGIAEIVKKTWTLIAALLLIIAVCAWLYYVGSPHGWGIQPTFSNSDPHNSCAKISFADCLHFSVVTIATLGYGDLRPESYGRLIAGIEVLAGLVLMGIFIARLVSRQQDRLTKRLVRGQMNDEIQNHRNQLKSLLAEIRTASTPLTAEHGSVFLSKADGLAKSIGKYWRHEAQEADLAEVLPSKAASRLLGDFILLINSLNTLLGDKTRADLHPDDIKHIRRITESILTAGTVAADRILSHSMAHSYERIVELISDLRSRYNLKRLARDSEQ